MAIGSAEPTESRRPIVALITTGQPLTASSREGDHEVRSHEAGYRASDLGFEGEDCGEGSPEVFDAADQVVLENVVLDDNLVRELDYVLPVLEEELITVEKEGTVAGKFSSCQLTGWMFKAASRRISLVIVSTSLLTPFNRTVWLRTWTPA